MQGIYIYPWDLLDEGFKTVIDAIHKIAKLNTLNIASVYHAGRFLLPHNPKRKVYLPEDGAVYFQPRENKYSACLPRSSVLVKSNDILKQSLQYLSQNKLKNRSWVVCLHNSFLGTRNTNWTINNVFGDSYITSLCPANPEVVNHICELVSDLIQQYAFDWIELESFEFPGFIHGYHHEKVCLPLDDFDYFLMSLCFCEHCRTKMKSQDIDIEKIQNEVKSDLMKRFESSRQRSPQEIREAWEIFRTKYHKFIKARKEIVSSFVKKVAKSIKENSKTQVLLLYRYNLDEGWKWGIDIDGLSQVCDGWLVQAYFEQGEKIRDRITPFLQIFPDNYFEVGLNACYPFIKEIEDMKKNIKILKDLGINNFSFYNYGFMPLCNLQWIGEALSNNFLANSMRV